MSDRHGQTRNVARALIVSEGAALFAWVRKESFYFLPGGGVDFGESFRGAVLRELWEELGFEAERVRSVAPIAVFEHAFPGKDGLVHEVNFIAACTVEGVHRGLAPASREDHLDFHWLDLSRLSAFDVRPVALAALLPKWARESPQASFFHSAMD